MLSNTEEARIQFNKSYEDFLWNFVEVNALYDTLIQVMKSMKRPTSCYFNSDEKRTIAEIAEREERTSSKIVQFAVRAFINIYKENPDRAKQLAQGQSAR